MTLRESSLEESTMITILVIQPDILVRMVVADYLRVCGYRVIEGIAADDAVAFLKARHKVDVILCEVALRGNLDGFGLARWVRERYQDVDVILTAGTRGAAAKAKGLCIEGPLEQPYHPQEIVRRINLLIDRRRNLERKRSVEEAISRSETCGNGLLNNQDRV
jgi:DNA-binding response OmpR family regulator